MAETQALPLNWLLQPISEDAPCGPDLEAEGAPAFIDYYYEAEVRLPERYVTPGMAGVEGSIDQVFDPKSINLRAETQAISDLLRQSRDLRLLSLLARFQILAGRPGDFADTLQVMAEALTQWPDALHPSVAGSSADRRAALEELGSIKTVVMPLHYLPLAGQADATYRRYLVATGQASGRASEEGIERGPIISTLASPAHQKLVERLHGDLGRAAQALSRIVEICAAHPTARFRPLVAETLDALTGMQKLLQEARPELVIWSSQVEAAPIPVESPTEATPDQPLTAPAPLAAPPPIGAITDRAGVRAALEGTERFLARNEPSSPALLLVTQARLLIGRPLIEALETLLPGDAGKAVIGFAPETGFALSMERMKKLSENALGGFDPQSGGTEAPPAEPLVLTSRAEVAAQLQAVEAFYAAREPASPIPILLARARGFMDKGFQSIVAELMPNAEAKG
ncbi:type VI secretion system ImpA family N-terminal domain-containing protein [uncultured Paracoccus sp.]|uniref:type VI secretion system protein TssA n=1 Tax=uncultured Paracoccus sp. TaxID=189685 RepID=UPI0026188C80|nr:type VI secretion system ImpA family N-terminal domain-containing protein [uncultured Paracoccus sp.]